MIYRLKPSRDLWLDLDVNVMLVWSPDSLQSAGLARAFVLVWNKTCERSQMCCLYCLRTSLRDIPIIVVIYLFIGSCFFIRSIDKKNYYGLLKKLKKIHNMRSV